MAKLIGSVRSTNFGENLFITKAQEFLDDNYIIYWNRQIYGREFDVCILMPGKGILVVELKGWREENILRIENSDTIMIKTDEGEIPATPQKQARGYRFALERHIRKNIGKFPLVFQMVCLPQVSKNFYHEKRLDVVLDEPFTILKEDLEDTTPLAEVQIAYLNQALKAGLTAATITAITQLVPELYKAIDYLIKHGEIDMSQIKQSGKKVTSNGTIEVKYSLFAWIPLTAGNTKEAQLKDNILS